MTEPTTRVPLAERLRDRTHPQVLTLAKEVRQRGRLEVREAVRLWYEDHLVGAASLLANGAELALGAICDSLRPIAPGDAAWTFATISSLFLELRQRVILRYAVAAQDLRPVPIRANDEGTPQPRRVCDLAYLTCYDLLDADRTAARAVERQDAFLDLDAEHRDKIIQAFFASRHFRLAAGDDPDDEA